MRETKIFAKFFGRCTGSGKNDLSARGKGDVLNLVNYLNWTHKLSGIWFAVAPTTDVKKTCV